MKIFLAVLVVCLLAGCATYQSARYSLIEQGVEQLVKDKQITKAQKEDILNCVNKNTTLAQAFSALGSDTKSALAKAGIKSLKELAEDNLK